MRPALSVAIALAFTLFSSTSHAKPRLAVLVLFDQLRSVEMERYQPFFVPNGFGGLDAARFDAIYSYAGTETGPGHATIATGANPSTHGIATNYWIENGKRRYVVDDERFPIFGGDAVGRSPAALVTNTLADAMKNDSNGRAKVVTFSLKDRSAIITAGHAGDVAVWYESALGKFTTSKAYVDAPPKWLAELGEKLPRQTFSTARWSPLPIPRGLEYLVPPDDRPGEGSPDGFDSTFPHDVADAPDLSKQRLYRMTPQSMDDLFNLALAALDAEQLGKDDEPDLLVVSVSTTDYVGHNFGPDSVEQLDTLRRADQALRRFVQGLESRLLARSFVIAVSSDHGAPGLPAAAFGKRQPNGVLLYDDVVDAAEKAARGIVPGDTKKRVVGFSPPQLFLDFTGYTPEQQRKVLDAVTTSIEAIDGIANVYDMTKPGNAEDSLSPLMNASTFPGRHAQLFVRQDPRIVFLDNREKRGTDHGTAYMYDRRVPFLLAGPGVRRGRYAQPVDPRDIAPTLAFLLGVPPPDTCEGKPVPAVGD